MHPTPTPAAAGAHLPSSVAARGDDCADEEEEEDVGGGVAAAGLRPSLTAQARLRRSGAPARGSWAAAAAPPASSWAAELHAEPLQRPQPAGPTRAISTSWLCR
eukprot:scaffold266_cov391-Prasinococcus_capsulatus_cf.AAC.34